ncbi:unnamed protein product [Lota lota]
MSSSRPSQEGPHSVSFAGCGFLATYQLGVAQCLLSQAPWILHAAPLVLGASSGSLVAAAVVCGVKIPTIVDELLLFASRLKEIPLGPLNPSISIAKWLEYVFRKHLPNDSHRLANGRLSVAVTRLPASQNAMVTDFHSKEDLVQALLCSCFVPGYCGVIPPSIKGVHYVDGGFTSMLPLPAHSRRTLTVSPFSGEADICPQNESTILDLVVSGMSLKLNQANTLRLVNALYPTDVEGLEKAYHSGCKDATHFLQSSDLSTFLTRQHLSALNRYIRMKDVLHLDTHSDEEDEEDDEEEENESQEKVWRTSLTDNNDNMWWMDSMAENEFTRNARPFKQEGFPDLNRALLLYLSYMSGFGFPTIVSYLLLPFNLPYFFYLNKEMVVWLFWVMLGCLQLSLFMLQMLVFSIQKNVKDRVIPVLATLQGLNVQAEYKSPGPNQKGDWYSSLGLHFSSSTSTQTVDTETSSVVDPVPSTIWLHLECEKEDEELVSARKRFARYHSIMG